MDNDYSGTDQTNIYRWMKKALQNDFSQHRWEVIDPVTDIADLTALAEYCADALGHDEWLDDPNHPIWDIAIEVAESLGFGDHD